MVINVKFHYNSCSFKFRLSDEGKTVHYRTMLTLHIDEGLHVRAYRRNSLVPP